VEGFEFIPFGDINALKEAFQKYKGEEQYCAFILEPIQGEGGVIVPPDGYLKVLLSLLLLKFYFE
jgi:acetylornithine/succinyldiaminopimelate/putrescine aminotransferase